MKVNVYNKNGEKIGKTDLPGDIFNVKINPSLIHQVAVCQYANQRQGTVHAKGRGEVSGGGKKPWAQKGTGRARHGSIRSPLWKGGGVSFGPVKKRNYKKTIPRKMKKQTLSMVISGKAKEGLLIVPEEFKSERGKTKEIAEILNRLPSAGKSVLIALPLMDKKTILAARNIKNAVTIQARDLTVLDLLNFQYLIMPKESIKEIRQRFLK